MDHNVTGWTDVNWTDLPEDKDQWKVLVNLYLTFGFYECGQFLG
jgi:hypothetical protein